jgi:hypothetical protein
MDAIHLGLGMGKGMIRGGNVSLQASANHHGIDPTQFSDMSSQQAFQSVRSL